MAKSPPENDDGMFVSPSEAHAVPDRLPRPEPMGTNSDSRGSGPSAYPMVQV